MLTGTASAWREWARGASPELMELFNQRSLARLQCVRRRYPGYIQPDHPAYSFMKHECTLELDQLAAEIQEEDCAFDQTE
jgi:hypothetical protein